MSLAGLATVPNVELSITVAGGALSEKISLKENVFSF